MQAQQALAEAVGKYSGKYICVVEGSIPTRDNGVYMKLAGRPAMEVLADVGGKAAAIVAIGSCAAWGGIPSADPDPTGAVGVVDLMPSQTIVNLPGCPPNPYTLLGVLLQFADSGTLPEMDTERRPKFAYDRDIHEHCPRRAHFDARHFVKQFGDEGHREGWCRYEMGCKGPDTHAGCSTRHFNEIPDVWPIGIGAPCIGCTEKSIAFRVPMFQVVQIHTLAAPPETYPSISAPQGIASPLATGLVGLAVGALAGAGYIASRKFSNVKNDENVPGSRLRRGIPLRSRNRPQRGIERMYRGTCIAGAPQAAPVSGLWDPVHAGSSSWSADGFIRRRMCSLLSLRETERRWQFYLVHCHRRRLTGFCWRMAEAVG
jgi:hydrogenase small subunit